MIVSVVQLFTYKFNELYKIKFWKPRTSLYRNSCLRSINLGFHSYTKLNEAEKHTAPSFDIVKCIIPKGARYYVNDDYNQFVSNQIIIKEICVF
jgi:hypothetical protein